MPGGLRLNRKCALSEDLRIGVLLGGTSSERSVSLKSGKAVRRALNSIGYRTLLIDPKNRPEAMKRLSGIDLAFIALHGRGGEDGSIQTLLESRRIPYTGSDARGSRLAYDKVAAKRIFRREGILTPEYCVIEKRGWRRKLTSFGDPCFFKPVCDGSSIGVFAPEYWSRSTARIESALERYGRLLVERKIEGREMTVGVFGRQGLPVVEVKPGRAFYDFRAKYTRGLTRYCVPAPVSKPQADHLKKTALKAHHALGLRDFSRVDFMVDRKGHAYVLEVNTIPGFTEFSLLPKAAQEAGISFSDLCDRLVGWTAVRGIRQGRR